MSSENHNSSPPWDDQRITAYVMNELTGEEKASFEIELKENETLADAVAEAREVTAKLSGFYASIPQEQLDASRRAQLSNDSTSVVKANPSSFKRVKLFAVAASIVFVLAVLSYPVVRSSIQTAQTSDVADEIEEPQSGPTDSSEKDAAPFDDTSDPFGAKEAEVAFTQANLESMRSRNRQYGQAREESVARAMPVAPASPAEEAEVAKANFGVSSPVPKNTAAPMVRPKLGKSMPSPAASSMGALGGGFALPTDTTKIQVDGMEIRGRAVGEAVDDLLEMLEAGDQGQGPGRGGDKYDLIVENTFKRVSEHPLSTLSIDVDTASYSKVRMSLRGNRLPRPDAVRIEEMLNYFEYDYSQKGAGAAANFTLPQGGSSVARGGPGIESNARPPRPEAGRPFQGERESSKKAPDPFVAGMTVVDCPWEPEHRLVRVGLQAIALEKKERPKCNLVFLIDTSGSMRASNKLPLVIDGMKLLLDELRPDDRVAIVVYAGSAGLVLDSTSVKKRKKIVKALSQLKSGGSTNGGAGLQLAYETARENFAKNGVNRVILCSDGDFNVGMTGTDQLVREAKSQAKSGVDLTVLGFGMGNHNDAMMERISNDAEGNYGFIDTIAEAKKVLVDQLTGTLVTVAKDVKIQVEFNPAVVSSYRLIGYENRVLAKEDFNDDKKDAGEIGAGHRVTAMYEVVPAGKLPAAIRPAVDPLKYQVAETPQKVTPKKVSDTFSESGAEMLTLKLRYKPPQGDTSSLMTRVLVDEGLSFDDADTDFRFAAAVAGFGMQLRNSEHAGRWTYDDVIEVARSAKGSDPHGLRAEMIELVEKARRLTLND